MLWAVARLGLHPGTPWLAAYLAAVSEGGQVVRAGPRDAANIMWALSRFGHVPPGGVLGQLLSAAVEAGGGEQQQQRRQQREGQGQRQRQQVQAQQAGQQQRQQQQQEAGDAAQALANTVWAVASLGLEPPAGWLEAWLAASAGAMGGFTAQGLANSLWALARLGASPGDAWLGAACAAAHPLLRRGQFKPGEASMLLHSLGRVRGGAAAAAALPGLLPAAQGAMLRGGLGSLAFADASNALWGLAVLREAPSPEWLAACLSRLAACARDADAQALSTALYALARLGARPPGEWWGPIWEALPLVLGGPAGAGDAAGDALARSSSSGGGGSSNGRGAGSGAGSGGTVASSKSLAVLAMCLGKLRPPPPPAAAAAALVAALFRALRASRLNGAELANAAGGLAGLRLRPSAAWLEAFDAALLSELPRMRPKEVANAALSLARMRHRPSGELEAAVRALVEGVGDQQQQQHVEREPLLPLDEQQIKWALQAWQRQAAAVAAADAGSLEAAQGGAAAGQMPTALPHGSSNGREHAAAPPSSSSVGVGSSSGGGGAAAVQQGNLQLASS